MSTHAGLPRSIGRISAARPEEIATGAARRLESDANAACETKGSPDSTTDVGCFFLQGGFLTWDTTTERETSF